MTDSGDEFEIGGPGGPSRPAVGPEQWLGTPDPVESFGSTIDQALNRLTVEIAGLRAERDGLRLELEGIRTQLQLTQQQLADRDRFASTVRELGQIVHQLSAPTRWSGDPAAAAAAQVAMANPYVPPAPTAPAPAAPYLPPPPPYVPPAPAPEPIAYAPPPTPVAPEPIAYAPPPVEPVAPVAPVAPQPVADVPPAAPVVPEPVAVPVAPEPVVPVAPDPVAPAAPPAAEVPPAPAPAEPTPAPEVAATPAAPVPPTAPSSFAPPATEPVEPTTAEPAAFAPPAAEPHTARTEREPYAPPGYSFASSELPSSKTPVIATEESFFSGPGVWIGEPPRAEERRSTLKTWATRVGSVLAGLIVAMVFVVSIGPKFLPYQMFFVRSGSMHPTFNTGDMVVLTKVDASDLKEGDVITFDRPDKPGTLVTHRIVGIKTDEQGRSFQTKGDANDANDPWSVPASGTGWKYSFNIPKLGFVFGYLGTPQARLALLAIPALLLGILSIIDIWKPQPKARGRR